MARTTEKLYRLPESGLIAGVASGFARYFATDVTLMRLIFVGALLITQGFAVIAYIILAVIMPTPGKEAPINIGERIENLAEEVKENGRMSRLGHYVGVGLIIFGVLLLLGQFIPNFWSLGWSLLWPGFVIIIGILILTRSGHVK